MEGEEELGGSIGQQHPLLMPAVHPWSRTTVEPTTKNKKVSTGGDKDKRREERAKLGSLRDLDVQPATKLRYEQAVPNFFKWAALRHISLDISVSALDEALADYIEHVWESGDPRGWATDAYSGLLKFVPRLKGECKASK